MNNHEFVLLMKKHPEVIDSSFNYKSDNSLSSNKCVQLKFSDNQENEWCVHYYFNKVTKEQLGLFFHNMSKRLNKEETVRFILVSEHIPASYKQLLDQFHIRWLELNESLKNKIKNREHSPSMQREEEDKLTVHHDVLVGFSETLFRSDLNTGWSDFIFVAAEQERSAGERDEQRYKKRLFQVYYKQNLRYEGALELSFKKDNSGILWPDKLYATLEEIPAANSGNFTDIPFILEYNLTQCIDWRHMVMHVQLPLEEFGIEQPDRQRIELILAKWQLQDNVWFYLNEFTDHDLESFVQKVISTAILLKSSRKIRTHKLTI